MNRDCPVDILAARHFDRTASLDKGGRTNGLQILNVPDLHAHRVSFGGHV